MNLQNEKIYTYQIYLNTYVAQIFTLNSILMSSINKRETFKFIINSFQKDLHNKTSMLPSIRKKSKNVKMVGYIILKGI